MKCSALWSRIRSLRPLNLMNRLAGASRAVSELDFSPGAQMLLTFRPSASSPGESTMELLEAFEDDALE